MRRAARAIAEPRLPRRRSCRCRSTSPSFDIDAAERASSRPTRRSTHWASAATRSVASMAAQFVDGHPGVVDGLVLWAAYSAADHRRRRRSSCERSTASLDAGVAVVHEPGRRREARPGLMFTVIEGGNHEQMGWYTGQPNDPPATIPRAAPAGPGSSRLTSDDARQRSSTPETSPHPADRRTRPSLRPPMRCQQPVADPRQRHRRDRDAADDERRRRAICAADGVLAEQDLREARP